MHKDACQQFSIPHAEGSPLCGYLDRLSKYAKTNENLVISGGSSFIKSKLAEAVHRISGRRGDIPGRLSLDAHRGYKAISELEVVIDCNDGGTVVLEKIEKAGSQVIAFLESFVTHKKLHGVERNVRLIAATSENAESSTAITQLRAIAIEAPRLDSRRQDIPHVAKYFVQEQIDQINAVSEDDTETPPPQLSEKTLRVLKSHCWNTDEDQLQQSLRYALVEYPHVRVIEPFHFAADIAGTKSRLDFLKQLARTGRSLSEVLSYFDYPPSLVLRRLGQEATDWRQTIGQARVMIVDDDENNIDHYKMAKVFLTSGISRILGVPGEDLEIDIAKPSELSENSEQLTPDQLRVRFASSFLIIADLNFDLDKVPWDNGYDLLIHLFYSCPWLKKTTLWVTKTDEDVFRSSYRSEATRKARKDPLLNGFVQDLLREIEPIVLQIPETSSVPPLGANMEPRETEWWDRLVNEKIRDVLRKQLQAIDFWLEEPIGVVSGANSAGEIGVMGDTELLHSGDNGLDRVRAKDFAAWIISELINVCNDVNERCNLGRVDDAFEIVWANYGPRLKTLQADEDWVTGAYRSLFNNLQGMSKRGELFDTRDKRAETEAIRRQLNDAFASRNLKRKGRAVKAGT